MTNWEKALEKANAAPRCGAKTRSGKPCKAPAMANGRCRIHGGKSPGAPCGEVHGMYKHGKYTKERKADRVYLRELMKQMRETMNEVEELV